MAKHAQTAVDSFWHAHSRYRKAVALVLEALVREAVVRPSEIVAACASAAVRVDLKSILYLQKKGRELRARGEDTVKTLDQSKQAPATHPYEKFQPIAKALIALAGDEAELGAPLLGLFALVRDAAAGGAEITATAQIVQADAAVAVDDDHATRKSAASPNPSIRAAPGGSITLSNSLKPETFEDLKRSLVGTYDTFRIRLSENSNKPVAREELEIFEKDGSILFRHWHLPGGSPPAQSFDGAATLVGHVIWLIGHSGAEQNRMRIMNFKFNNQRSERYSRLHWGLLLSDLSRASHEPAAERILVVRRGKQRLLPAMPGRAEAISLDDVKSHKFRSIIHRFSDNSGSAYSISPDFNPPIGQNGTPIEDKVLKVSQDTVDTAAQAMDDIS